MRCPGDGAPIYGLHVRPKHTNRHGTGHGGFLATLADTFMAAVVHHQRREVGRLWTLQLTLEYRRPATMGAWLECHLAGIERQDDLVNIQCELRIGDTVTAKAYAVFKVEDRRQDG